MDLNLSPMRRTLPTLAALLLPLALPAQERQILAGANARIYNLAGDVRVEPGTGNDIVVEITRGGRDASKLEVRLRDGQLTIRYPADQVVYRNGPGMGSSSTLRVREDGTFGGEWDRGGGRRTTVRTRGEGLEAHADLVVKVPAGKRLALHHAVGRVRATDVEADLDIDLYSASVEATGVKGRLFVDAGSGSVRVDNGRGELEVDTGSGSTTVSNSTFTRLLVDAGSGSVEAREVRAERFAVDVGSGSVYAEGVTSDDVEIDTGSGSVRVAFVTVPSRALFDTGSGSVTLTLPADANADLDIETGSGGISSDFPITAQTFDRRELRGRIGGGGPTIRVSTGSGGVRLLKR